MYYVYGMLGSLSIVAIAELIGFWYLVKNDMLIYQLNKKEH